MGFFRDAQGQLTLQCVVGSDRNSNSVETLWLSLFPASMKKIQSKMKELEWPQDYKSNFKRSRADNSIVKVGIWQKFELIQAFMHVLITCKYEEDSIKNEGLDWPQHISHRKPMGFFPDPQGQLTLQSVVGSRQNSNSIQNLWLSSLPARMKKIQ